MMICSWASKPCLICQSLIMKYILLFLVSVFVWQQSVCAVNPDSSMRSILERSFRVAVGQSKYMYELLKDQPGRFPKSERDGRLETCNSHWWTSGFFPGTLWYLYEHERDSILLSAAKEMTNRVAPEQFTTNHHDVGFQINCSFGNGYRLTGREDYCQVLLNAGRSLSSRFSVVTGCIRSWDKWNYAVIIDNMMNLELLLVASILGDDPTFSDMARSHADKTLVNHFREDASSYHCVDYDPRTGAVLSRMTHQGASDASSWSRGQAWGLYGYTMMYRFTRDKRYLDQAIRIGTYLMRHPRLPEDKVPYWDFDAPNIPDAPRDASAAAIMASAYVALSTYVSDSLGQQFLDMASVQIRSLSSPAYLAALGTNHGFILMHSTGFFAKNSEVDAPLSYADYYFVEALIRYERLLAGAPVVDMIKKR